jgi:hypothetical protein
MRATELTELRRVEKERGPQDKLTELGHTAALEFLSGRDLDQYAVTMTEMPKVGVNPRSGYNTPLGIYFYPADYYVQQISAGKDLPFVHGARYINILKFSTKKILYVSELTDIEPMIDKLGVQTGQEEFVQAAFKRSHRMAKMQSPGGQLWYVMWALSAKLSTDRGVSSSAVWNWLIRKLGYDIVIDRGGGIIHDNEPTQGLIVNPAGTFSLAARIINHGEEALMRRQLKSPYHSEAVQLAAVRKNGYAIDHIKNPSEAVQLAAVRRNISAIQYIKNPTEAVQLDAVQRLARVIEYIENPTEAVQLAAVRQDGRAIQFITNPTPKVLEFLKKLNTSAVV